ncbi:MAG: hypothetical protein AB1405_09055 [Bdellovibrionota bacterium]
MERIFLGYDPGGKKANGAAILRLSGPSKSCSFDVHTFDSIDEVIRWFKNDIGPISPQAAGIDTFLSWATTQSGWRPMDEYLRETYLKVQRSVLSSNSAAGAMGIQDMAMALQLKQIWPDIKLNETHPKVLYYAIAGKPYKFGEPLAQWLSKQIGVTGLNIKKKIKNEHEWDALISAWATRQGLDGKWNKDLMKSNGSQTLLFPAGPATYFWPG